MPEWLTNHWPVITTAFVATLAIGAEHQRINTIEEAVKADAEAKQVLVEMQANDRALDERTKQILDRLDNNQQLIQQLILQTR